MSLSSLGQSYLFVGFEDGSVAKLDAISHCVLLKSRPTIHPSINQIIMTVLCLSPCSWGILAGCTDSLFMLLDPENLHISHQQSISNAGLNCILFFNDLYVLTGGWDGKYMYF